MKRVFSIVLVVAPLMMTGCTDSIQGAPKQPTVVTKDSPQIMDNSFTLVQATVIPELDTGLKADEVSKPIVINEDDTQYETIEWTDLLPKEDLNALLSPPSYITNAKEGSLEDQISSGLKSVMATEVDDPYQRALVSKSVVLKFDGQAVKLAGFVVPLEFNDEQVITEFFFVPFFGACVHVPAPPPNQIIYVRNANGFKLDALYNPIWVSGILSASLIENDIAISAYTLDMASFEYYKEPD